MPSHNDRYIVVYYFLTLPLSLSIMIVESNFTMLSVKCIDKQELSVEDTKTVIHKIDHRLTVKLLMKNIREKFPSTFTEMRDGNFVMESRKFVQQLVGSPEFLDNVLSSLPEKCSSCYEVLVCWVNKEAKAFLLSLGHLKEVKTKVKSCPKCGIAYYPDFGHKGLIFAHNKFLLTIEYILDILNCLKTNGCLIECIKDRLLLLAQVEGLTEIIKKDIQNTSVKLEKIVIAIASLLVKDEDLDSVQCWLCGNCPKFVSTDGNTKVGFLCILSLTTFYNPRTL